MDQRTKTIRWKILRCCVELRGTGKLVNSLWVYFLRATHFTLHIIIILICAALRMCQWTPSVCMLPYQCQSVNRKDEVKDSLKRLIKKKRILFTDLQQKGKQAMWYNERSLQNLYVNILSMVSTSFMAWNYTLLKITLLKSMTVTTLLYNQTQTEKAVSWPGWTTCHGS